MKNVFMAGVFITLLFCGSPSLSWATSSQTVETVQQKQKIAGVVVDQNGVNPEKPDVPLNKNDAFQKVQKRRVQEKR